MCPEGAQRLPADGAICCNDFRERTLACFFDIRYEYWPAYAGWFVIISPDAGGGGVAINFCPHCGLKLEGDSHAGRYIEIEG
jgi:hypothetical protein